MNGRNIDMTRYSTSSCSCSSLSSMIFPLDILPTPTYDNTVGNSLWYCHRWVLVEYPEIACAAEYVLFIRNTYHALLSIAANGIRLQLSTEIWFLPTLILIFCAVLSRLYKVLFFCESAHIWVDMHTSLIFSCTCSWEVAFSILGGEESSGNMHPKIKIYYRLNVQLTWIKAALLFSHVSNW